MKTYHAWNETIPTTTWLGAILPLPTPLETLKTRKAIALGEAAQAFKNLHLAEDFYLAARRNHLEAKNHFESLDRELAELDGRLHIVLPKLEPKTRKCKAKKEMKRTRLKAASDAITSMTEAEKKSLLAELMA